MYRTTMSARIDRSTARDSDKSRFVARYVHKIADEFSMRKKSIDSFFEYNTSQDVLYEERDVTVSDRIIIVK